MPSQPRTRRDPAKERSWRQIIRRQQRSGLSVRAYCEEKGLKESAFRWWQGELRRRERGSPSAPPRSSQAKPIVGTMPPTFLPVRVVEGDGPQAQTVPPIEIVLPDGPTVRVPAGFDPRSLTEVLTVLGGRSC